MKASCQIIFIILIISCNLVSFGQDKMTAYLDSLDLEPLVYVEFERGYNDKAEAIRKDIDTTSFTKEQIDKVVEYYEYRTVREHDSIHAYLNWAKTTAERLNYKQGLARLYERFGDVERLTYKPTAEDNYRKALAIHLELEDYNAAAVSYTGLGLYFYSKGEFEKALAELFKSLEYYEDTNNKRALVGAYHNIGDTYLRLADSVNVVKYLTLSNALEKDYPAPAARAMNASFLGEIYLGRKDIEKATQNFELSNSLIEEKGVVPYLLYYNLKNLGIIEETKGNDIKALNLYKQAFSKAYLIGSANRSVVVSSTKMASILLKMNKGSDALSLLSRVEKKKIIDTSIDELSEADFIEFYAVMAKAYERLGNVSKALLYRQKQLQLLEDFNQIRIHNNTTELEKKYQSKLDQQEIQSLKDENSINQRTKIIMLLGLVGLVLILLFGAITVKQRSKAYKQQKTLNDLALNNEHIKASDIKKKQRITQLELELSKKELTTNSMSLLQKKEQYGRVIEQLKDLRPLVKDNEAALNALSAIISDCLASKTNYNWDEFKLTFESVHASFYDNLIASHPNLSPNEKKICAFLKLGLNTKDISAITLQNTRTIVIARSRLRKKLGLNKGEDLVTYVNTF